jgi:hypothetical protein
MAEDLTKVFPYTCDVWVAKRTDPATPVAPVAAMTGYTHIGAFKAGTAKLATEKYGYEWQGGTIQTGVSMKLEVEVIETDDAKMTAMKANKNAVCDFVFKPRNSSVTKVIHLPGYTPSGPLPAAQPDGKNPMSFKIEATGIFDDGTDGFKNVTLT